MCHGILLWMNKHIFVQYLHNYSNISVRIWIFDIYVHENPQKCVQAIENDNLLYTYPLQCSDVYLFNFFFFYILGKRLQLQKFLAHSNQTFRKIRYSFTLYLNTNMDKMLSTIYGLGLYFGIRLKVCFDQDIKYRFKRIIIYPITMTHGNHVICKQTHFCFSWASYNSRVSFCSIYKI